MDFISLELLEKILSPKDLVTFGVIWYFIRGRVSSHFASIEMSLDKIGRSIDDLQNAMINLEENQTKKINELGERVTRLELKQ